MNRLPRFGRATFPGAGERSRGSTCHLTNQPHGLHWLAMTPKMTRPEPGVKT